MKSAMRVLILAAAFCFSIVVAKSGTYESVDAYSTDTYRVFFSNYGSAWVRVVGDNDTDLDVYVYDENGRCIGSDTGWDDNCFVRWTPRWSGVFLIQVVNHGDVYNRYWIETN